MSAVALDISILDQDLIVILDYKITDRGYKASHDEPSCPPEYEWQVDSLWQDLKSAKPICLECPKWLKAFISTHYECEIYAAIDRQEQS